MSTFSDGYHQGWRDAKKERAEHDKAAGVVTVQRGDLAAMLEVYEDRNTMELNAGAVGMGEDLARATRIRELLK